MDLHVRVYGFISWYQYHGMNYKLVLVVIQNSGLRSHELHIFDT